MSTGTRGDSPPRRPAGTVLESVEEIREQFRRRTRESSDPAPAGLVAPVSTPTPPPTVGGAEVETTRTYRPSHRPSMAILTVFDDGEDEGEVFRIRGDRFVIGRVEGDIILPNDSGISGRHAEIARASEGGIDRWTLRDLGSTNGTFVRVSTSLLKPGQEILVGSRRFRFEAGGGREASAMGGAITPPASTQKWQVLAPGALTEIAPPTLVELMPAGEGPRHRLDRPEVWIGRDPSRCSISVDDPMVNPRHARFARTDRGQWVVANARSLNGVWIRVDEVPLGRGAQFRCGEQRFSIRVLDPKSDR